MKTYTIKRLAVVSTFALLASATPVFAQSGANSSQSSAQPSQSSRSVDSSSSSAQRTPSMMTDTNTNNYSAQNLGTPVTEPAGADNTGSSNWSWFGLLGLLGLFGLKRHHDVRDDNYRPVRS